MWRVGPSGQCAPLHALTGHGGPVLYCAWSPDDSKLLTVCEDAAVRLWDAASGSQLHMFGWVARVGGISKSGASDGGWG